MAQRFFDKRFYSISETHLFFIIKQKKWIMIKLFKIILHFVLFCDTVYNVVVNGLLSDNYLWRVSI